MLCPLDRLPVSPVRLARCNFVIPNRREVVLSFSRVEAYQN